MLWNLTVNYGGLNASDLLAQKGYYLVFKVNGGADGNESDKWYAFVDAFYLDEEADYNSMGYLNASVYSVQFAVLTVAPDDTAFGGYDNALSVSDFVAIGEVYYNQYFAA
jgi:hypothetical protein